MGWFLKLVKPKIKSTSKDYVIPENLWKSCPVCTEMIFSKEWEAAQYVCPNCNFHERISARKRIELISDAAPKWLKLPIIKDDPILFNGPIKYSDKLKDERKKTKEHEAALAAETLINGKKAIVFAMDFNFIGGSMGRFVGSAFEKSVAVAIEKKLPLIAFTASGGARMQEGIYSLMQMPKTVLACEQLKASELPYIVVLTDPTTGGVIASFASLGDITLAEPNALIGFTGPRIIEETMQIKLDPDFQKSEFQIKHGFVDHIVMRADLKVKLAQIISILMFGKEKKKKI